MPNSNPYPSYPVCVAKVLSASPEPLSLDTLLARIGEFRPVSKTARNSVYNAVSSTYQAVPVAAARYGWLSHLLTGSTIRHSLEADEIRQGVIHLDELEHAVFFPQFFQNHEPDERTVTLEPLGGDPARALATADSGVWTLQPGEDYRAWLDETGAIPNDDLIIHVMDGPAGRYSVRVQPRESRDEDAIDKRNRSLVSVAEEIAVDRLSRSSYFATWDLVARLVGRGIYSDPVPPDDLHYVLHEYSVLRMARDNYYALEFELSRRMPGSPPRAGAKTRGRATGRPDESSASASRGARPNRSFFSGDAMDEDAQGSGWGQEGEDTCEGYEEYLESLKASGRSGKPLSHDDFHLLEAELESLVDLELEFGYLLPDQIARKQDLADRLFIDPESLVDGGWDDGDDLDADSPALWN